MLWSTWSALHWSHTSLAFGEEEFSALLNHSSMSSSSVCTAPLREGDEQQSITSSCVAEYCTWIIGVIRDIEIQINMVWRTCALLGPLRC